MQYLYRYRAIYRYPSHVRRTESWVAHIYYLNSMISHSPTKKASRYLKLPRRREISWPLCPQFPSRRCFCLRKTYQLICNYIFSEWNSLVFSKSPNLIYVVGKKTYFLLLIFNYRNSATCAKYPIPPVSCAKDIAMKYLIEILEYFYWN